MIYDYVVIGAGSAGCAVAARLAESGEHEVVLLEAGGPDDLDLIHVPAGIPFLFKSAVDWDFATEPQKQLKGRADYAPRGKTYGGTSSINAQVVQRGAHGSYDEWAEAGNKGWAFADLLPIFKHIEHNERGASEWHGVGGPINVADQRDPNPVTLACIEAAIEAGYARNDDFNGVGQLGFGMHQVSQKEGTRCSAARGYLHPSLGRENFTVVPFAQASRLTFDGRRCTGVVYRDPAGEHTVTARREVVLSAGAFGSPQLLLLSGVGGRHQLERHGIDLVAHLPGVGENLYDHVMVPTNHYCTQPITLAAAGTEEQAARFANEKMGLLTSNLAEGGGFVQIGEGNVPDVQFHFGPLFFLHHGASNPEGHGFVAFTILGRPRSVGRVELRSADPAAKPVIDPNFLDDERDLDGLVAGVRIVQDILGSAALNGYRGDPYPAAAMSRDDEEVRDYIRDYAQTLYHPVGTCAMGSGQMAVVDHELRVHGVDGLRVADASVMPYIVNANTNFPSIMIGERCAELMLG